MGDMTREEEIQKLEHAFWDTMISRDAEAALKLTDDPCVVAGAQGTAKINHEMFRQMMTHNSWTLHRYEFKNPQVIFPNDDTAIVSYEVHEELTVEGKPLTMEAADTSVWVRRDGGWVCSLHTESLRGDPYGRDKIKQ
jgi:ketosteroid isomerase-like protein